MKNPFTPPSALKIAVGQLEEAQRGLLVAASYAEYYRSHEAMLTQRIIRLRGHINLLTAQESQNENTGHN